MKLGTSSPLFHRSPEHWAEKHEKLGLKAINFSLNCKDDEQLIDEYVKQAGIHGLTIAEVGIWKNPLSPNEVERADAIDYSIGQLALADRIKAKCCVNIMGARGERWDGAYKDNFSRETWDLGVKTIRKIIDEVKPKNTFFTIESMPWMVPTGPNEYLKLIDAVERDEFAVHLDIFNWITTPQRYFYNEEFIDECAEKLGAKIKSCHLKDVKMEQPYTLHFTETYPGNGGINIKYLIDKMCEYNPDMPFIIEHLNTDEEYLESVEYVTSLFSEQ